MVKLVLAFVVSSVQPLLGNEVVTKVALLTLGGAVGTNARYWLGRWISSHPWAQHFPLGTFVINVSGSLIFAATAVLCLERKTTIVRAEWFLLIATGFCGAYTTFSTFEWETFQLVRNGHWPLALLNVLGSVAAGFIAVVAVVNAIE